MTFFNRGNLNLDAAVEAYSRGVPVIVLSTDDKYLLHGRETADMVAQLGTTMKCLMIHDVSGEDWNNSDWLEVLEAARRVFMEKGGFESRRE